MKLPGHSAFCHCGECRHTPGAHVPLFHLCEVSFNRGNRQILTDVNFTVDRGDFIAITGPNGGGKTTLLRIILGLLKPTKGVVDFCGSRPSVGYLPQKNSIDSHFPITVSEVVQSGLLTSSWNKVEKMERVKEVLEEVGMASLAERPIGALSGGQLQRTLFARAIASRPGLIVLDEPLSYLDKNYEERIYHLLEKIAPQATIMLVSHEMSRIGAMANRHIIVDGQLVECNASHHYVPQEC